MNWVQEQSGGRGGRGGDRHEEGERQWMRAIDEGGERGWRWAEGEMWEKEPWGGGIKRYLRMEIPARGRGVGGKGGWTEGAGVPLSDPLTKGRVGLWCCWHSNVSVNVAAFSLNVVTYTPQDTVAHSEVSFPFQCLCEGDLRGDMEVPLSLLSWLQTPTEVEFCAFPFRIKNKQQHGLSKSVKNLQLYKSFLQRRLMRRVDVSIEWAWDSHLVIRPVAV